MYKNLVINMADVNIGAGEKVPPLTLGNVLKAVEGVKNWYYLGLWVGVDRDSIIRQHNSDEACLKALIEKFLLGEGGHQPSWRRLIYLLDLADEVHLADKIKSFGEPVQDPTLTTDNVAQVLELVNEWASFTSSYISDADIIPHSRLRAIQEKFSTKREITNQCASCYVHCYPHASWTYLARFLYKKGEFAAVEKLKPFLPLRDLTISTKKVNDQFSTLEDVLVDSVGLWLDLPDSKKSEIQRNYHSPIQRREAYIDVYVNEHPHPTWKHLSQALRRIGLPDKADEVEITYVQVSEQTKQNFNDAMKDGEVSIRSGSSFLLGAAGSGKTFTLHAFLKEDPPVVRQSTTCAKKAIRTIAQYKLGVSDTTADKPSFIRITDEQFSDMLSISARYLPQSHPRPATQHAQFATSDAKQSLELGMSQIAQHHADTSLVASPQSNSPSGSGGFQRELLVRMNAGSKSSDGLDDKILLDLKDSAGQSMFHEVLPMFISKTLCGFLVVKLNESLDSHPMMEYFTEGKRLGKSFPSPFSHLQIASHCIKAVHSAREGDKLPMLVFIGTHKDLEHQCKEENRDVKNRKLLSIIPDQMKERIIPYSGESLIFPINALNPGDEDEAVLNILRRLLVTELQKIPPVRIPHRYFALEMAFQRLAKKKPILSRDECFQEARKFHFTKKSFEDALKYLQGIKLIMYFEEILPDVVFIDAQVLLQKITELVEHSLLIQSESCPPDSTPTSLKEYEKFKFCGIITRQILSRFKSGYVTKLFMEDHLILVFEHLLIVAKVGEGEYLMSCLLQVEAIPLPLGDSASPVPALLFYFGEEGPKLGVYCALLSSLITESNWKLLMKNRKPVQLSRNQARFKMPGKNPGYITITDSISDTFFQVDITFSSNTCSLDALKVCKDVCPSIRETILTGIRRASRRLNYTDSIPEVAFFCSKHQATSECLHAATISDSGLLICSSDSTQFSKMTELHKVWLYKQGEKTVKESNCLDKVLDFDSCGVSKHLGQIADSMCEWEGSISEQLGLTPADVAAIKTKHPSELNLQIRAALDKWKQSQGSDATYRSLTAAFEHAGRKDFAETVRTIAKSHPPPSDIKCPSTFEGGSAIASSLGGTPSITKCKDDKMQKVMTEQHSEGPEQSKLEDSTQESSNLEKRSQDECPTLGRLSVLKTAKGKRIKIIQSVASQWQTLGDLLEFDKKGKKLKEIKETHQGDSKECSRSMFQHWIEGNGVQPCSWSKLIEILEDCDFEELAAEVHSACTI